MADVGWLMLLGFVWGLLMWANRRRFRESRRLGAMDGRMRETGRGGF